METQQPKPGYLNWVRGEATDSLDTAFIDDGDAEGTTYGRRFRDRLIAIINVYGQSDQAGPPIAAIVEKLPWADGCPYHNAFIGHSILQEVDAALNELLGEDDVLRESLRDERDDLDPETRLAVHKEAQEFDEHFDVAGKDAIGRAARDDNMGTDREREIADSAAGDHHEPAVAREKDEAFRRSADDSLDRPPDTIEVQQYETPKTTASGTTPLQNTAQLPQEEAVRVQIETPNYHGQAPATVFRNMRSWLAGNLIAVASGSKQEGQFPRIAPLTFIDDPTYAVTQQQLVSLVAEIRRKFDLLQSPGGGSGGFPDADAIQRKIDSGDTNGAMRDMLGAMEEILGQLQEGQHRKGSEWDTGMREGGWKDSE